MASLFGLDPSDPSILSIIGASLRDAGAAYGGRQSNALENLQAQQRQSRIYQQLQQSVLGTPNAPGLPGVNITPNQITGGGGMNIPAVAPGGLQGGALGGSPQAGQLAQMLSKLPPEVAAPIYMQLIGKQFEPQAPYTLAEGATRFGPDGQVIASNPKAAPVPQGFSLTPGQTRFGPDGKPIAELPPAPDLVSKEREAQLARIAAAGRAPREPDKPPVGYRPVAGGATLEPIPGGPADPNRPGSGVGRLTEDQAKNTQLYDVASKQLPIALSNFDAMSTPYANAAKAVTGVATAGFGGVPNVIKSSEWQQGEKAIEDIAASYLYSVSGATANPGETQKLAGTLTPAFGDSAATLKDKKQRLQDKVDSIKRRAGGQMALTQQEKDDLQFVKSEPGAIPVMNTPEEAMKLPPGTTFKTPDGRVKVR